MKLEIAAAALAFAIVGAATTAAAVDPCRQAYEREEAARTAFLNWCHRQPGNRCSYPPGTRGYNLYHAWMAARAERESAC